HPPGRMRGLYLQTDFGDQLPGYRAPLHRVTRHDDPQMTARVLVVDDILSNVKLLEAKLTAEYFEVITAFNGPSDRVTGLDAGADDYLTKPVDDAALFARVRSLVRLKMMTDELRMRESTGQGMGLIDPAETLTE